MKYKLVDNGKRNQTIIKVVGVGGCGGNAIDHMVANGVEGVETISANTDSQALTKNKAAEKIILGELNNHGQGAGGKPDVGRDTALDDYERLTTMFDGADMVFIAAGMGGGTGTGAAPIVARAAKEVGALAVAIVTKPMSLEFKDDIELIAVAMPYDLPSRVVNFKNKNELPFKVAIDPESKILGEFEQVKLTPTTIISDKNKVIKQTIIGEINYEDLKEIILKLR